MQRRLPDTPPAPQPRALPAEVAAFRFWPTTGESVEFDFQGAVVDIRRARSGRLVLRLAPGLEVVNGERVGPEKFTRIKAAVVALGGVVRPKGA